MASIKIYLFLIGKIFYKIVIVERKEIEKDVDLDIIECKNLIDIYKKSSQNAIKWNMNNIQFSVDNEKGSYPFNKLKFDEDNNSKNELRSHSLISKKKEENKSIFCVISKCSDAASSWFNT